MRELPGIVRSYEKYVNLFRPGNILYATNVWNALAGYNRPARQPAANFSESSGGHSLFGQINQLNSGRDRRLKR